MKGFARDMRSLAAELDQLEEKLRAGGGAKKIERQHRDGKLTARERVTKLIDPGTAFLEIGLLIAFDKYDGQAPAAGVITGAESRGPRGTGAGPRRTAAEDGDEPSAMAHERIHATFHCNRREDRCKGGSQGFQFIFRGYVGEGASLGDRVVTLRGARPGAPPRRFRQSRDRLRASPRREAAGAAHR